jgi:hypothetical protein
MRGSLSYKRNYTAGLFYHRLDIRVKVEEGDGFHFCLSEVSVGFPDHPFCRVDDHPLEEEKENLRVFFSPNPSSRAILTIPSLLTPDLRRSGTTLRAASLTTR